VASLTLTRSRPKFQASPRPAFWAADATCRRFPLSDRYHRYSLKQVLRSLPPLQEGRKRLVSSGSFLVPPVFLLGRVLERIPDTFLCGVSGDGRAGEELLPCRWFLSLTIQNEFFQNI